MFNDIIDTFKLYFKVLPAGVRVLFAGNAQNYLKEVNDRFGAKNSKSIQSFFVLSYYYYIYIESRIKARDGDSIKSFLSSLSLNDLTVSPTALFIILVPIIYIYTLSYVLKILTFNKNAYVFNAIIYTSGGGSLIYSLIKLLSFFTNAAVIPVVITTLKLLTPVWALLIIGITLQCSPTKKINNLQIIHYQNIITYLVFTCSWGFLFSFYDKLSISLLFAN